MRRITGLILTNGILVAVGAVLQRYAVEAAYFERGYWAVGGEWLIIPICIMAGQVVRSLREMMKMEGK